ncbi:hypothetical protein AT05_02220 [Schleiferia thermophila str. Yellowstone]|jgi:hypothetical protein|uniref:Uncharacterized protein n=1 Tax=Schleiferia thermophila TaxID=884107 RepID=A0A369A947_9FLAO|nr:hypothetical protein AT05_02220 [Schleiferia thermophila str. Yellowstone]RCX05665.1 hypothetical protein DES35_101953 [Schleiferia thermophila]
MIAAGGRSTAPIRLAVRAWHIGLRWLAPLRLLAREPHSPPAAAHIRLRPGACTMRQGFNDIDKPPKSVLFSTLPAIWLSPADDCFFNALVDRIQSADKTWKHSGQPSLICTAHLIQFCSSHRNLVSNNPLSIQPKPHIFSSRHGQNFSTPVEALKIHITSNLIYLPYMPAAKKSTVIFSSITRSYN